MQVTSVEAHLGLTRAVDHVVKPLEPPVLLRAKLEKCVLQTVVSLG